MDRNTLESLLCDARYARRQCQLDNTSRAADALDRILCTLSDLSRELPGEDDALLAEMSADLGELERIADEPLTPTVRAPAWHKNVKLDGGQVVVDVFCQHLPPITLEPLEPWYRDRTVWGFWILVAAYCGLTAAL